MALWRRRKATPPSTWTEIGATWLDRYYQEGSPSALDQAITCFELAVDASSSRDPEHHTRLSNLGAAYNMRFRIGGQEADLDRAIDLLDQATSDSGSLPVTWSNLGMAYQVRFKHQGLIPDLDRALDCFERALAGTGPDDRPALLSNLGGAYVFRFRAGGGTAAIDKAIALQEEAVATTPPDHPRAAVRLDNLGVAYSERFQAGGNPGDLDKAITFTGRAVAATADGHSALPIRLSNLAGSHRKRYDRDGAIEDLEYTITLLERAIESTMDSNPELPGFLSNLCLAYRERYAHGGVLTDLDRAIVLGESAVARLTEGHTASRTILSTLGGAYQLRHLRTMSVADATHAIDTLEQALTATPEGHSDRPLLQAELGTFYLDLFESTGSPVDLHHATTLLRAAAETIPETHTWLPTILSSLGAARVRGYEYGQDSRDLEQAIGFLEQAVAITPSGHPKLAIALTNLVYTYMSNVDAVDSETLQTLVRQVDSIGNAAPRDRVLAGQHVGTLAHAVGDHHTAVEVLDTAVALLPTVAARGAAWSDLEHRLGGHIGVVSEAVAAHCAIGDPTGAVEVAELGRGILLAAQLDSRTDLTEVDQALPSLATALRQVRDQLNAPDPADRARAWGRHDELVAEIRQHPGFHRFLLPPRFSDLQKAVPDGTIVLLNSGRQRGDAILIGSQGEPEILPLPHLTFEDVQKYGAALLDTIHTGNTFAQAQRRNVLRKVLSWLWDSVAGPVVEAVPDRRVWWLPTGVLGLFPLHAAGHPGEPGALDAVVSSYIPTLRALAHANNRPPAPSRRQLTVALAHTPGLPDLQHTIAEAEHLQGTPQLADQSATVSQVLAALPDATWAHFACHAGSDLAAPSNGGLHLYDGTLTIPEISHLQLTHAELAYLSACSTAHRGWQHADESIHLASAFQLAGFRHVIASLWPVADTIAATAAKAFYTNLPDASAAATALHNVTRSLRTDHPAEPDLWAALIHSGP